MDLTKFIEVANNIRDVMNKKIMKKEILKYEMDMNCDDRLMAFTLWDFKNKSYRYDICCDSFQMEGSFC